MADTHKVGCIVFDELKEFILVEIIDDVYSAVMPECNVSKKYSPFVAMVKSFEDKYGKHIICWEQVIEHEGVNYFTVTTDISTIELDDNHDIIHIEDIHNIDCNQSLGWLAYMSLDKKMKNNVIISQDEREKEKQGVRRDDEHIERHDPAKPRQCGKTK